MTLTPEEAKPSFPKSNRILIHVLISQDLGPTTVAHLAVAHLAQRGVEQIQLVSTWKQHKEKKSRYGGFALKKEKEIQGLTKHVDEGTREHA